MQNLYQLNPDLLGDSSSTSSSPLSRVLLEGLSDGVSWPLRDLEASQLPIKIPAGTTVSYLVTNTSLVFTRSRAHATSLTNSLRLALAALIFIEGCGSVTVHVRHMVRDVLYLHVDLMSFPRPVRAPL